mgnify:CR=1 FL=1|tara:strand:+ start:547 stop:861 length:315 start_codon:yes stop_codon:yes gene_type:complete
MHDVKKFPNDHRYLGYWQPSKEGHRFFVERSTGDIHLADESGYYPDQTDDGILVADLDSGDIISCDRYGHYVPVVTPDRSEGFSCCITYKCAVWLSCMTGAELA